MPEQPLSAPSDEAVRCYWCGLTTIAWHAWRWCLKCEAPREHNGQPFKDDDDA